MNIFKKKIFTLEPKIFGLDLGDLSIKILDLEKIGQIHKIKSFGSFNIPAGYIEDGNIKDKEKVAAIIKEAVVRAKPKKIKTHKVICSLPESKVFLRVISIPEMQEKELSEAIKWEMEANIPMPIDQVYFDWQLVDRHSKNRLNILTVAVEKKIVDDLMETFKKADLDVWGLEAESIAITRSLIGKIDAQNRTTSLIVDLGSKKTSFILTIGDIPFFTSSIPFSSESINDTIAKALNLSWEQAEEVKINNGIENLNENNPIFEATKYLLENLVKEIEKTLDFFSEISKESPEIRKIILSGGAANLKGLPNFISTRLKKEVEIGNPWVNLNFGKKSSNISRERSLSYPTVIGLALRGIDFEI